MTTWYQWKIIDDQCCTTPEEIFNSNMTYVCNHNHVQLTYTITHTLIGVYILISNYKTLILFLKITDKRVSRNHAILSVDDKGNVKLCPVNSV